MKQISGHGCSEIGWRIKLQRVDDPAGPVKSRKCCKSKLSSVKFQSVDFPLVNTFNITVSFQALFPLRPTTTCLIALWSLCSWMLFLLSVSCDCRYMTNHHPLISRSEVPFNDVIRLQSSSPPTRFPEDLRLYWRLLIVSVFCFLLRPKCLRGFHQILSFPLKLWLFYRTVDH